ncbi:LacI family DNA-binding transcriptional regulator [uncultured Bifidobacterium sp.]|nr:LacI family DNA-binding transcriptional regulator [uncultured Bifidobacterium sp.]
MAGIKDVAAEAGVSISTVSYVLSGKRRVSDETKLKVLEAVRLLDYRPKRGAAMLRQGARTRLMALSSPMHSYTDYSNYAAFFFAVVARARRYHYNVVLLTDENEEDELLRMSYSGMVDGVLLLDVNTDDERVAHARTSMVPYVSIGCAKDHADLVSVDTDFEAMGRMAIDEFYRLGHRNVLMIGASEESYRQGSNFLVRTRESVETRAKVLGMHLDFRYSTGDDAVHVEEVIASAYMQTPGITAIMAQTNISHMNNVIGSLFRRGKSIPGDVSLLALSTFGNASVMEQPIDEIPMQPNKTCSRGVDMLMDRLEGRESNLGAVELIPSSYLRRGSVGPVSGRG